MPGIFDTTNDTFTRERDELRSLLTPREWAQAERTTINAHYTDPRLATAVWHAVRPALRDSARVLEPGCGSGTFIGLAPTSADIVGVELDPTTAAIAQHLNPQARIRAESFADTNLPQGTFDLVIGNVPFANVVLHDRTHNPGQFPMHDHFILKSLALTRPGGTVAVITSRFTLDKTDPAARQAMAELGDLVGAARLPGGAHRRTAGTDVITDVLIFTRRVADAPPGGYAFTESRAITLPDRDTGELSEVHLNRVFLDHPDLVLGELGVGRRQYATADLQVTADSDVTRLSDQLRTALSGDTSSPMPAVGGTPNQDERGPHLPTRPVAEIVASPSPSPSRVSPVDRRPDLTDLGEGFLEADPGGPGFTRTEAGMRVQFTVPKTQAAELRSLLRLRDTYLRLVTAEATHEQTTPGMDEDRAALNLAYNRHVQQWGPLTAVRMSRTGRIDSDGDEVMASRRRPQGGFRLDPYAPVVLALEHYDPLTGAAVKADIFRDRILSPRRPRRSADSPADAIAVCLDTHGRVDLPTIATLLGSAEAQVRTELLESGLVFDDPQTDELLPRAEYLSGNVRSRVQAAADAAADAPDRYRRNVAALQEVLPPDLGPDDIEVRLGGWIGHQDVQAFLSELLEAGYVKVTNPGGGNWKVDGPRWGLLAQDTWGTEDYPTPQLAEALLRQHQLKVTRRVDDHDVLDVVATEAAVRKGEELNERFASWVWEDAQRAQRLTREYNDRFNAIVLRQYDGEHLSLPGLATSFTPRPHQRAAVARIVNEPAVGLFHVVGAGKTAEMAMGVMELRRLGMVGKPAVIVPNHLVGQFTAEFLRAYPAAKILAAGLEDMGTGDRRRGFLGRVANNDWDAVIFSRESFKKIPVSDDAHQAYLQQESDQLSQWIANARAQGAGGTIKSLQKKLMRCEERLKAKLDAGHDAALTFEQSGIDYLVVDEAHDFKNLRTASNSADLAIDGSQRSDDLNMKLTYLRSVHGDRVATFATGTPVANSMTELHVMTRYLRPDLLQTAGLETFDEWVATFAVEQTGVEVKPTGGGFRVKSRISKFRNIPELMRMVHVFGDVKMAEDLDLPRPAVVGGHAELISLPPTAELEVINADIAERVERTGGRGEGQDNLLALMNRARLASLDPRLVIGDPHDARLSGPVKVDAAAERITSIWQQYAHTRYGGSPVPGALQLVFADLGVPHSPRRVSVTGDDGTTTAAAEPPRWSIYDALRDELVTRGVPREQIVFIHEAGNDKEKAALFDRCRNGQVSVLIGSTQKMGTGTNVQLRAIALHHLDPSWRPADIEQREGRIIRQGNLNPEVQIVAYATQRSFDAYMWQTVERKAKFIGQVMRGRLDVREIEDVGESAVTAGQFKAIAAGDPLLMEQAAADAEVQRLTRLLRNHDRTHHRLRSQVTFLRSQIVSTVRAEQQLAAAEKRSVSTRGDAFAARIGHRSYNERPAASAAIATATHDHLEQLRYRLGTDPTLIGALGGHEILVQARKVATDVTVTYQLREVPQSDFEVKLSAVAAAGVLSTLEHRAAAISTRRTETQKAQSDLQVELDRTIPAVDGPFAYAGDLAHARQRSAHIAAQLAAQATDAAAPESAPHQSEDPSSDSPAQSAATDLAPANPDPSTGGRLFQDRPDVWLTDHHRLLDRLIRKESDQVQLEQLQSHREAVLEEMLERNLEFTPTALDDAPPEAGYDVGER